MKHRIITDEARPGRFSRGHLVGGMLAAGLIGACVFGGVAASASTSSPTATQAWTKTVVQSETNQRKIQDSWLRHYSEQLYNKAVAHADAKIAAAAPTVTSTTAAGTTLPHIGGSWSSGHTVLGSKPLAAGTYLVTVTGDFYRAGTPGSCQDLTATPVLQIQVNGLPAQVTAFTAAFPADPGETCGLGSDGTPNGLEQTASASATVVVPADATAEVDAFGYNPDRGSEGSGAFGVRASFTATKLG